MCSTDFLVPSEPQTYVSNTFEKSFVYEYLFVEVKFRTFFFLIQGAAMKQFKKPKLGSSVADNNQMGEKLSENRNLKKERLVWLKSLENFLLV